MSKNEMFHTNDMEPISFIRDTAVISLTKIIFILARRFFNYNTYQ